MRGLHIFTTTFMKNIPFCTLTGNEKEKFKSDTFDVYTRHVRRLYSFIHNFQSVLCPRHSDSRSISQRER